MHGNLGKRKLRIVVLTPLGRDGAGGMDRMWDKVRAQLQAHGNRSLSVEFVTTRGPYRGWRGTFVHGPFFFGTALVRVAGQMMLRKVDVLHVSLASRGSALRKLCFVVLARSFRVPHVIHLMGGGFQEYWQSRSAPMTCMIDWMFDTASAIIVLGSFWKKVVTDQRPFLDDRVTVLPNASRAGRDKAVDRHSSNPVHILYLGRLERPKGTPELIEALSRLKTKREWVATLAGNGDVAESRLAVAAAGLSGRVELPGWIDEQAVERKLEAADILVLPSHYEGLPNVIVEAFGHGLAVVATPVGAVPDIVEHDRSGLLVAPGDVAGLTEAIGRVIDDGSLRHRLGRNARQIHREKLDLAYYLDRLVGIWKEAADARP